MTDKEGVSDEDDAALASLFHQMRDEESVDWEEVLADDNNEVQGQGLSDSELHGEVHHEQQRVTGTPQIEHPAGAAPGSENHEPDNQLGAAKLSSGTAAVRRVAAAVCRGCCCQ